MVSTRFEVTQNCWGSKHIPGLIDPHILFHVSSLRIMRALPTTPQPAGYLHKGSLAICWETWPLLVPEVQAHIILIDTNVFTGNKELSYCLFLNVSSPHLFCSLFSSVILPISRVSALSRLPVSPPSCYHYFQFTQPSLFLLSVPDSASSSPGCPQPFNGLVLRLPFPGRTAGTFKWKMHRRKLLILVK